MHHVYYGVTPNRSYGHGRGAEIRIYETTDGVSEAKGKK